MESDFAKNLRASPKCDSARSTNLLLPIEFDAAAPEYHLDYVRNSGARNVAAEENSGSR